MSLVRLIFSISFPIVLTLAPLCYLLFQFNKKKMHFHWAGVLSYAWCVFSFIGLIMHSNGMHNKFLYHGVSQLNYLFILYFIPLRNLFWLRVGIAPLGALTALLLFYFFQGDYDKYVIVDWSNMIIHLFSFVYVGWALIKMILSQEHEDLFLTSDFWIKIGFLTYFFSVLYSGVLMNFKIVENSVMIAFAILIFGNAITSFFLILGFKQWAKNLSQ